MSKILASIATAALIMIACSSGSDNPSSSPVLREGMISIYNQSSVPIRLREFTQERAGERIVDTLNVRVYTRQHYSLKNKLDPGNSDTFPGGDRVWVGFVADAYDPEHPGNPLFENTVALIVNGNNTVTVKSGGEYNIGPE